MKNAKMTICLMAACLFMTTDQGFGWTQYKDGGTHNINSTINDDVWVDYQAPGMQTTVNLLTGGEIPAPYKLHGYNNSRLNISDGSVYGLSAYGSSLITISGGSVNSSLYAYDNSQITNSGGWVNSSNAYGSSQITMSDGTANYLYAYDNSQITMSGGLVNTNLSAHDNGRITMSGGSVNSALQAIGNGQVTMSGGSVDFLYATDSGHIEISDGSVGYLRAYNNSLITISGGTISSGSSGIVLSTNAELIIDGFNFSIDGSPVSFGQITSIFGGSQDNEPYRQLTGILANGDIFNNSFKIGDSASITLTPEPATLLLFGLGGLALRRKK